jgi:YihY family inner membrane protein
MARLTQSRPTTAEPAQPQTRQEPETTKGGLLGRVDLWQQRRRRTAVPVAVVRKFADDRAGRLAALIAYYGFFSLFPALLAMTTILGYVLQGRPDLRARLASSGFNQFPVLGDTISESVSHPLTGSALALVIGLVGAIWAGLGAMQAVQDAMNEIWEVPRADAPGPLQRRLRSLALLALVATTVAGSSVLASIASTITTGRLSTGALLIATAAFDVAAFAVGFRLATVAEVSWRRVLPGAIFAGVAYTVLQAAGSVYVAHVVRGAQHTYGTFALVIGLLSWMFLVAQFVLVAAELNVVVAEAMWPRSLFSPPATGADRRSIAAQAHKEAIVDEEHVSVDFDANGSMSGAQAPP